ncbi:MAG TPA: hypothetical protein VHU84_08045, partial [Lacipirellulaceae bacterium]|nr:hypothetical protein [Lacipirellulaceae bacterium]
MTKVNYPNRRSATATSARQGRWSMAAFAAIVCCTLLAVTYGAEQYDSGWAIGQPSPIATGEPGGDTQLFLRHMLSQTQQPLLQTPPPKVVVQPAAPQESGEPRVAARAENGAGWHAPGQPGAAATNTEHPVSANNHTGPQLGSPVTENQEGEEADCSGHNSPPTAVKKSVKNSTGTSLADAYDNVPEDEPATGAKDQAGVMPAPKQPGAATDTAKETAPNGNAAGGADANVPAATSNRVVSNPWTMGMPPAQPEAVPPPPLTKQLAMLRSRVRSVLKGYYRKPLNSKDNDPWEVMHGMLSYGVQSRIRQGGANGEPITSVGWLCYNKPCKGQTLMYVNPAGEVRAKYGVGLQGHLGQLLAMLAQCQVSPDYPIHVGKNEFTINDLIEAEKKTCYPKSELTFKLIALQHYIDLNDKWVNDQGVDWDMPRLVREELAQPIRGAACGGTHRLSGLSLTVKTRIARGEPLDGEYARAAEFVKKYQQYAFRLQNPDGSLSTNWFRGPGDEDDINRKIKTTGHILEWLCYSLSDEELRDQRTVRAVTFLANLMYSNYDNEWEIGPRSHATHALLLYDERVFQPFDKDGPVATYQSPSRVAKNGQSSA